MIFVSNLLGSAVGHHEMDRDYWADHARQCVRFRQGVETLIKKDIEVFIEIGPQPTLIAMAMQAAHAPGLQWLPSVRRQGDDWEQLTKTIAALYTAGVDIDWAEFDRPYQRRAAAYPNYPFQRSRLQETATKPSAERVQVPVVRPAVSIPDDTAPPIEENSFPVFELEWVQRSVAGMAATGNRHWLVIGNDPLVTSLSSSLVKLGDEVQQLDLNDAERGVSEDTEGSADSRVVDWIQEQCERFANVDGVIFTSSLDCQRRDQDLPIALQELLHLVQSLSSTGRELSQRLWVLTRGAAPIAMETIDDAAAMIWGMVQTVSVEVCELRPACIDLDNESDIQQDVESVLGCLTGETMKLTSPFEVISDWFSDWSEWNLRIL